MCLRAGQAREVRGRGLLMRLKLRCQLGHHWARVFCAGGFTGGLCIRGLVVVDVQVAGYACVRVSQHVVCVRAGWCLCLFSCWTV